MESEGGEVSYSCKVNSAKNKITVKTFVPIISGLLAAILLLLLKPINNYMDITTPYADIALPINAVRHLPMLSVTGDIPITTGDNTNNAVQ